MGAMDICKGWRTHLFRSCPKWFLVCSLMYKEKVLFAFLIKMNICDAIYIYLRRTSERLEKKKKTG